MKTREFIERLNLFSDGRGCYVKESEAQISLIDSGGRLILVAHKYHQYILDVNHLPFHHMTKNTKEELFQLVVEYTKTPTEEREEEKKYAYRLGCAVLAQKYLKVKKNGDVRFEGHRDFSTREPHFKSKFTDSEVENYPKKVRELFKICEKIEVTE